MARVKRGIIKNKRRRNVLAQAKGYRLGRGTKKRQAKEAIVHAGVHAFAHRRDRKNDFRKLWNTRISAAVQQFGFSYSTFIGGLKKQGIGLNRKMLSELANNAPATFERVVKKVS